MRSLRILGLLLSSLSLTACLNSTTIVKVKPDGSGTVEQITLVNTAALKGMMKRRFVRIIGITSVVGVTGNPGQGNYAASKAGMIGMSKSLAAEVATRNITVNCIAPGFIASPMTDGLNEKQKEAILATIPAAKLGSGDDIAAALVYLASREAAYVTGQTLHVNGGMAMI